MSRAGDFRRIEVVSIATTPQQLDRRPIAARRLGWINRLAAWLARRGVRPNAISIAGLLAAVVAGGLLAATRTLEVWPMRGALVLAAALIQFRLLCNLIDGLVAVEGKMKSATGDIFNEVPDRIADAAVLIGAGYALGSLPVLGWGAALAAVLVAYIRAVGRSLGFASDFRGPMAKQQRMFVVTAACVLAVLWPGRAQAAHGEWWGAMTIALAVIIAGCIITFARRLRTLMAHLREREAERTA